MIDDGDYQKLLNAAFRFISFRPRSEKEIKDFLQKKLKKKKTYTPMMVGKVMDRMTELGYVDDAKFVTWWVEQRSQHRPKGKRALVEELRRKGVSVRLIETFPVLDEKQLAWQAIEKKLLHWKHLSTLEKKKKMYDFLGRRGFSFEAIDAVIGKEYNEGEVE